MIFILTGQIRTGKTRWLENLMADLELAGVAPYGVIAPGVWADRRDSPDAYPNVDANGFEKLGIDNVLLPRGEHIAFARRIDLAMQEGSYDSESQSGKAGLSWDISDEAINRVNEYFGSMREAGEGSGEKAAKLLVIDELGRLELERGEGLTQAIALLEDGPTPTMRHALVVVRESLLPQLEGRFEAWGKQVRVSPDEQSRQLVFETVLDGD